MWSYLRWTQSSPADILLPSFMDTWEKEDLPKDWTLGTIVGIPEKGNLADCNNWKLRVRGGATLPSIRSKVFCIVIIMRIENVVDITLRKEQAAFRRGRGTKGVARGGPGVHVTLPPPCKPFCKQTTYNIQVKIWWEPSVRLSVTPLWKILATPMGTTEHIFTLWSISELCSEWQRKIYINVVQLKKHWTVFTEENTTAIQNPCKSY